MTIFKNNSFLLSLNRPPRSMKNHGKHRRTFAPAHSGAAGEPSDRAGGTAFPSITNAAENPKPPTVPHAGIRAGEIVGHRVWLVIIDEDGEDCLCSVAHRHRWLPGATQEGVLNEMVNDATQAALFGPIWGGVYAFSSTELLRESERVNIEVAILMREPLIHDFGWWPAPDLCWLKGMVLGTVSMWGEVVEHEQGWRSERARIRSLDEAYGLVDLAALHKKYLIDG